MYILIFIFYISLLAMIGMVVLKRHELRTGRPTVVSRMGRGTDHIIHNAYGKTRYAVSHFNRRTALLFVQWIAYHVLFQIRKVYVEIKHKALANPHTRKVVDAVRGRGEIKNHGASFYLRRIAADDK